ncbi:RAB6A-GEF complex partner protein 2-like isoform X2 [Artemia franciscana]|uniref:RAB6A-GEF complex partner protein 2 n=1 Tax=Artemia franciscana TaxID=6661 RepID=A0AA88IIZ7_ARTSF|nr:hypothetical protein QYM36_008349 [Artemia franciscana]
MILLQSEIPECAVFFAGSVVTCNLSVMCKNSEEEGLAWGSAQVIGIAAIKNVGNMKEEQPGVSFPESTSLSANKSEKGHIVYSTKPKILFCDIKIPHGEVLKFAFEFVLPQDLPPSHNGSTVRYSYKIKLAVQRVGESIKFMQLPFRVLSVKGIPLISTEVESPPMNPFLPRQITQDYGKLTLDILTNLTSRRSPVIYNIVNQRGKVAKLCIFKSVFRLGEDIIGFFDFSGSQVPCYQSEEKRDAGDKDSKEAKEPSQLSKPAAKNVIPHAKCHEMCLGLQHTNFSVPIPLHGTQTFHELGVSLSWKLHFEFVTCASSVDLEPSSDTCSSPPSSTNVETMTWDFPIQVFPAAPAHIDKALLLTKTQVLSL